jgi:hypothetical protein
MIINSHFLLRLGPSLMMILFGLNQLTNPDYWIRFIPQWIVQNSPVSPYTIMRSHAIVNILLGIFLLSGWHSLTATWITIFWFISILPFAYMFDWTIGLRDTAVVLGLISSLMIK